MKIYSQKNLCDNKSSPQMCRAEDGDEKNYFTLYSALSYNVIYSSIWAEIVPEREKDSSAPALDIGQAFQALRLFEIKLNTRLQSGPLQSLWIITEIKDLLLNHWYKPGQNLYK